MNDLKPLPDVLTVEEVADYLRVSKTTVCRWCKTGKLPAFRIGRNWRVQRSDLERSIKRAVSRSDLPPHAQSDRLDESVLEDRFTG